MFVAPVSRGTQNPKNTRTTRWAGAYEMRCTAEISAFPQRDRAYDARSGRIPPGARQETADLESANPPWERRARISVDNREALSVKTEHPIHRWLLQAQFRVTRDVRPDTAPPWPVAPTGGCSVSTKTEAEIITEIADIAANAIPDGIAWLMKQFQCQSPIERVMAAGLYARFRYLTGIAIGIGKPSVDPNEGRPKPAQMCIFPQAIIGEYKVDFLIVSNPYHAWGSPIKIVVECDGHEFHERTKQQAAHDKARDRKMQKNGYTVLRFTGSEIWGNPMKCSHEVFECFLSIVDEQKRRSLEAAK